MSISDQPYTYSLVLLLLHKPCPLSHISPFSCCFAWPRHFFCNKVVFVYNIKSFCCMIVINMLNKNSLEAVKKGRSQVK